MKVFIVTLLALRLASHSSSSFSATIVLITCQSFYFDKWCLLTIIMFNHSFQHIRIVFFFLGGHECSFICHVKSVKNIPTTFQYVKIAQHFICN